MARICMVVHAHYPFDPRVRRQAEALVESGNSVEIICLRDSHERGEDTCHGVAVHRLDLTKRRGSVARYLFEYMAFLALATFYLTYLHLKRRFQIIHVHNMPDCLIFCALMPWTLGAKVILDVHDPMTELFASIYGLPANHWLIKLIGLQEKISYAFPCLVVTVNESMRERLVASGVSPRKLVVIFNSPDPALFRRARQTNQPGEKYFTLVYSGTVAKRYGLDVAVRAVAALASEMPDLRLRVVGTGDFTACRRLVSDLGLEALVEFQGKVPHEQLIQILQSCTVGISPHRNDAFWRLYFGTKLLEYLELGLPVISSRTKTVEAYLKESVFYFEPEDVGGLAEQIRLVRARPDLVRLKRASAGEILDELSWDHWKVKIQQLVRDICPEGEVSTGLSARGKEMQ